jgi:hypothetical protein
MGILAASMQGSLLCSLVQSVHEHFLQLVHGGQDIIST